MIGSHSVERLVADGHEVHALARNEAGAELLESIGARVVPGSVEDPSVWESLEGTDLILHAAAVLSRRATWSEFESVNVGATRLMIGAAKRLGARIIHISSVAVYGRTGIRPITEEAPFGELNEMDFYSRTKRLAEELLWDKAPRNGVRAVALRPCFVYGERDRLVVPRLVRAVRSPIIPIVGRGDNKLSMVYAGNVADAVRAAVRTPEASGAFNVTNDGNLTQRELFQLIAEAAGRSIITLRVPTRVASAAVQARSVLKFLITRHSRAGFATNAVKFLARENPFSSERAYRELNWQPSTPPAEGLARAVRWFVASGGAGHTT